MSDFPIRKEYRSEVANIENLIAKFDDADLTYILGSRMFWYRKHAEINKNLYRIGSLVIYIVHIATAVAGVAAINGFSTYLLLAILPITAVSIRATLDLYSAQENWKRYRSTLEKLREEAEMYISGVGTYKNSDKDSRKSTFVVRTLEISSREVHAWGKQRTKDK